MVYPIGKRTIVPLIKGIWVKEVSGIDNIPKNKAFIVVSNHASYIDDLLLPVTIVSHINKYVHIYCTDRFMKNWFCKKFLQWGRVILIRVHDSKEKEKINKKAFEMALGYLEKKEPVGIFPEGHRSEDGKLQKAKVGAAKLALTSKVDVIPIGIIGSDKILPKHSKFPKLIKCKINIGKPLTFEKFYGKENDLNSLKEVTKIMMNNIGKLIGQKYSW